MIAFLNRIGEKRTRRSLYAVLTLLIAAVVIPGLGGMVYDRLLKPRAAVVCQDELAMVKQQRAELTQRSLSGSSADLTGVWLALRERSVVLRRQCKADPTHGAQVVQEDDLVRRTVAAYRVQRNL
jgi:hypothetical protein